MPKANRETRQFLSILGAQLGGALHWHLRAFPAYSEAYARILTTQNSDEQRMMRAADQLLLAACTNPNFAASVAYRSPSRVAGLFWALLAAGLTENDRYELQHFGAFSASEKGPTTVQISFKSSLRLHPTDAHEFIELPEPYEGSFVSKVSYESIETARLQSVALPQNAPTSPSRLFLLTSEVLSNKLKPIFESVLADGDCLRAVEKGKSWSEVLGMAVATAGYYSWILAFESELTNGHDIDVPGIGVFEPDGGEIHFDASRQFGSTLAAAQPQRV